MLSAAVGITSNLFFFVLICLLSWWHLHRPYEEERTFLYSTERRRVEAELQPKRREAFMLREPDGILKYIYHH
jgi:hypothetical protein